MRAGSRTATPPRCPPDLPLGRCSAAHSIREAEAARLRSPILPDPSVPSRCPPMPAAARRTEPAPAAAAPARLPARRGRRRLPALRSSLAAAGQAGTADRGSCPAARAGLRRPGLPGRGPGGCGSEGEAAAAPPRGASSEREGGREELRLRRREGSCRRAALISANCAEGGGAARRGPGRGAASAADGDAALK